LLAGLLTSLPAIGQQALKLGPFGRPVAVCEEGSGSFDGGCKWELPIILYEDAEVEMFTSDITSISWKVSFGSRIYTENKYLLSLYTHFKSNRYCSAYMYPSLKRNDPRLQKICEELVYRGEQMVINVGADSVQPILTSYMGEDAEERPDQIKIWQSVQAVPFDKLNQLTGRAVRAANRIVNEEMTDRYRDELCTMDQGPCTGYVR
jgi:hypothetical protein